MKVTTIGLDVAKSVFQVHGIADDGTVVVVKRLLRKQVIGFFSRAPSCLIGMEACATAHHWARVLAALGHEVKLMPPAYVKAYVKRARTTPRMPRRSAKPSGARPCASFRSRRRNSKAS